MCHLIFIVLVFDQWTWFESMSLTHWATLTQLVHTERFNQFLRSNFLKIQQEYDNPIVQDAVHALIAAEMRTFVPSKSEYLAHLPYPQLKFAKSTGLQVCFVKVLHQKILSVHYCRQNIVGFRAKHHLKSWKRKDMQLKNQKLLWKRMSRWFCAVCRNVNIYMVSRCPPPGMETSSLQCKIAIGAPRKSIA